MKAALVLVLATLAGPAWADLADFEKDVNDAEANPPAETVSPDSDTDANEGSSEAGDLIAQLFAVLWGADNLSTTYGPRPYADGGFIRLPTFAYSSQQHDYVAQPRPGRDQWFTGEVSIFQLDALGSGGWLRWTGHFWRFFGPDLEAWALTDGHQPLAGARAGVRFSLLQSDPLSVSLYGQWMGWTGALVRSGGVGGVELKSYPFRPLSLQLRWGLQAFPRFRLAELEAQAGLVFGTSELFLGWRSWTLPSAHSETAYQGAYSGWRWYL